MDSVQVELLPVANQVQQQVNGVAGAALQEADVQAREAARHAAQEDAPGGGVVGLGEMPGVVVDEVVDRLAIGPLVGAPVNRHRHAELYRESLPIAGVDGTLRNRMNRTAAEHNVRANSGTIGSPGCLLSPTR